MRSPERGIPTAVKAAIAAGTLAVAAGAAAVGLGGLGRNQSPVETPTPSSAAASPTPERTIAPTLTPTAEPTPSPTPEAKQEVPCLILEQKYCDEARRMDLDINGTKVLYIVINVPDGEELKTPVSGLLVKAQESGNLSGFVAQVRKAEGGAAIFRGDIKFDDMLQKDVKEGTIIAQTGNTGAKVGKDFDLAFTLTKRTETGPVVDEENLKKFFPKAYEKPVLSGTANPAVTVDYGQTPPPSGR